MAAEDEQRDEQQFAEPEATQPTLSGAEELAEMTDLDESRVYAALSYIAFFVLIPLLTRRDDPFVNFHARQGLLILAGFIIASIAAVWLNAVGSILFLILLVTNVIALVFALQGRRWKIPLLGFLAEKIRI